MTGVEWELPLEKLSDGNFSQEGIDSFCKAFNEVLLQRTEQWISFAGRAVDYFRSTGALASPTAGPEGSTAFQKVVKGVTAPVLLGPDLSLPGLI